MSRNPGLAKSKIRLAVCEAMETRRMFDAPGTQWTLSFADEFNGTTLDTNKWRMYLPWTSSASGDNRYHNSNYASYMMPDDLSVNGGVLSLTTQKRDVTSANGTVFHYTQAMITSNATFWQAYGYFEVRAKLPTGGGNWPAFWTLANGWPPESDIMEMWTSGSNHQGLYGMDSAWHDKWTANPSNNFHTFAMEWAPGSQKYYIDGVLNYTTTTGVPTSSMYMLLNSGVADVHKANFANVAAGNLANTLQVDYVHVYSYNASSTPNLVNGEMEASTGFGPYGGAAFGTTTPRTGDRSLRIVNSGGAEQTITGLLPNTQYTFIGYGYTSNSSNPAYLGVKNYGGSQLLQGISSTSYARGSITFTTGSATTSATVFCYNPATAATTYFDDLSILETPVITAIPDVATAVSTAKTVPVNVNAGTSGSFLTFTATSSNTAVVANTGLAFTGSGTSRSLVATPVTGAIGTTTITVTVTDTLGVVATETYQLAVTTATTINGTAGDDVIRLVRSGTFLNVFINNVTATPTASYSFASTPIVTVLGGAGNDTLIIDYSGGDPVPDGGVGFDGSTNTDTVSILGSSASDSVTLTSGSITYGTDSISYTNAEAVNIDSGGGSDTLYSSTPITTAILTVNVTNAGTVTLATGGTLPTNTIFNVASGTTLNMNGESESIDQLTGLGSVINGGGTLTVGASGGSSTFSGSFTGSGGITKVGAGMFTLSGSNNFTGALTLGTGATAGGNVNGILRITKSTALTGVTLVNIRDNNSAYNVFQLDGTAGAISLPATTLFSIAANNAGAGATGANVIQNIAGANTIAGALTLGVGGIGYGFVSDAGTLTFSAAMPASSHVLYLRGNGNGAFTGDIAGTASIILTGPGMWTFSGSSSYTGSTTVSGGTLRVGAGGATGLIPGAIINNAAVVFNRSDSPTFANIISGTGNVSQSGAGTVTLSGASTYTGTTSVTSGTLIISGAYSPAVVSSTLLNVSSGAALQVAAGGLARFYSASSPSSNLTVNGTLYLNGSATPSSIAAMTGTGTLSLTTHTVNATGLVTMGSLILPTTGKLIGTATGINTFKTISLSAGSLLDLAGTLRVPTLASNTISLTSSSAILRVGTLDLDGTSTQLNWTAGTIEIDNSNPTVGTAQALGTSLTVPANAKLLLTDTPGGTVTGQLNIATGGIVTVSGSINPTGTAANIAITDTGTLTINLGGVVQSKALNSSTPIINNGSLSTTDGGLISGMSGAGSLNLTGGTLQSNAGIVQDQLSIANATTLGMLAFGGNASASKLKNLVVAGTGTFDLADNDLVITNMTMADVKLLLAAGYSGATWQGTGIVSSSAAADASKITSLGASLAGDLGYTTFDGFTGLASSAVLIKFTYYGDTQLDGRVNTIDLVRFLTGYGATNDSGSVAETWNSGDSNFDGIVNTLDLVKFLLGYGGTNDLGLIAL